VLIKPVVMLSVHGRGTHGGGGDVVMVGQGEPTDVEWMVIEPLLPAVRRRGVRWCELAIYLAASLHAKWHGFQTPVRVQGVRAVVRPSKSQIPAR